jgi:pyruvate,water dikinase
MIRNYLKLKDEKLFDNEYIGKNEKKIRKEAEHKAFSSIGSLPKRLIFSRLLRNARLGVKNRENMRFARTRIYGLLRKLINAVGLRFEKEGILNEKHDIFYLTIDEVWDYIKGTAVTTDLKGLVELRKREFSAYNDPASPVPDDHFETYGAACHRNLFVNWAKKIEKSSDGSLQGAGCCPGIVREKVKILKSPKDDMVLNGEILVAGRTDPGWVPIYPAVSGILIERGSILSHSAIVAREMGIPAIVGIPELMDKLKDGQVVEMDGKTGIIKIMTLKAD